MQRKQKPKLKEVKVRFSCCSLASAFSSSWVMYVGEEKGAMEIHSIPFLLFSLVPSQPLRCCFFACIQFVEFFFSFLLLTCPCVLPCVFNSQHAFRHR